MKPTTVRDLLLGLGLTAGLGGLVQACSSQDNPPSHPDNGNEGGINGGGGAGGTMGNANAGGFTGGTGGVGNAVGGFPGAGGFTNFGTGGNAIRGGAPGQLDASDDATSDGGNTDAGDPIDVGSADMSEDGG